jgi:hypothetical protein
MGHGWEAVSGHRAALQVRCWTRKPHCPASPAATTMATLFYLHWDEDEAQERAQPLVAAGHKVHVHWRKDDPPKLPNPLPEISIISLDRLPSHGRAVAEWLWEAKSRRHIPIIFEGGTPGKVATTRSRFPKAHFCASGGVLPMIAKLRALAGDAEG